MDRALKTVETQAAIISLLSHTVDDLFKMLLQHISAKEADCLPALKKINEAATLKADMERTERL